MPRAQYLPPHSIFTHRPLHHSCTNLIVLEEEESWSSSPHRHCEIKAHVSTKQGFFRLSVVKYPQFDLKNLAAVKPTLTCMFCSTSYCTQLFEFIRPVVALRAERSPHLLQYLRNSCGPYQTHGETPLETLESR